MRLELALEGGGHGDEVTKGNGECCPAHYQGDQAIGGGVYCCQLQEALEFSKFLNSPFKKVFQIIVFEIPEV